MSNIAHRTSTNVFYKARCNASIHNDQLRSRDSAAAIMSIDGGRLYRIESGVANPYPEEILMMADLYGAPELRNYYCTEMCPLGCQYPKVDTDSLDRIGLRALASFREIDEAKDRLLRIMEDGTITQNERTDLDAIIGTMDKVSQVAQNLKVWAEKHLE